MREYLTIKDDIASVFLLAQESLEQPIILVEGNTDKNLLKNCFNSDINFYIPFNLGNQKQSIITIIDKIYEEEIKNTIGIIDADFDKLGILHNPNYPPNIFVTDFHDINVMLFCSPVLLKYLEERGSIKKAAQFFSVKEKWEEVIAPLRELLINCTYKIGLVKILVKMDDIKINFTVCKLKIERKYTFDFVKYIKILLNSNNMHSDFSSIYNKIEKLEKQSFPHLQVINGHDIFILLALLLRKALGSNTGQIVKEIEKEIRMCFECRYFTDTKLFVNLANWAKKFGFKIFRVEKIRA